MNTLRLTRSNRITRSNYAWFFVAASILALMALVQPRLARAQGDCADCDQGSNAKPTNAGTDFLLCFERNHDTVNVSNGSLSDDSGYLELFVGTLGAPATITITCKHYPSLNKVITLAANSSQTYTITGDPAYPDLWIVSDEVVDDRVVRVHSTAPIVCSGMNYKFVTADATMALPQSSSATDYGIMSYQNSTNASASGEFCPSQFVVAAFDDNTTVTITPSAPTLGGHAAGAPFTITLNSGECVQVQPDTTIKGLVSPGLDLTGSHVSSSSTSGEGKIAVYAGNARTEIPAGFLNNLGGTSRDLVWEAMPPTSIWGYNFVLDAITIDDGGDKGADGDLMRVLANSDNSVVTVNGKPWVTLNKNQFADSMIMSPMLVHSSGPLLVGEFAHTTVTDGGNGDPFLAIVPPVDQSNNNYTFLSYQNSAFSVNHVIIATDTRSQGNFSIDGALIPSSPAFEAVPGSIGGESYSLLQYAFTGTSAQGVHTITSPSQPQYGFTLLSYGLGTTVSYGFAGGSLLVPKRALKIEYPPESMGKGHSNAVNFRNICYMPDYMDSAFFITSDPKLSAYGIHFAENVATDIGRLAIGASATVHLVADGPLAIPVSGTVKMYCHTPAQFNLEPAEMPFTLYPDASAGITPGESVQVVANATPNPFSSYTNLNFSMPETGDVTIILYDELGRVVQNVASGEFPAGPYSVRLYRRGIANGVYTCVITSEKLNFKERVAIVAGE